MIFCLIFASNLTLSETKVKNFVSKLLVCALSPMNTYIMRFRNDFKFYPTTVPSL